MYEPTLVCISDLDICEKCTSHLIRIPDMDVFVKCILM